MSFNKNDKQFINKIWQKIHVLNYEKQEEEIVKRNNQKHFKHLITWLTYILLLPLLTSCFVFWLFGITKLTLIITGFVVLSLCAVYENTSYHEVGDGIHGNNNL